MHMGHILKWLGRVLSHRRSNGTFSGSSNEAVLAAIAALALAGLFTAEAVARLGGAPLAVGQDGYYYAVQARAILETGLPYYATGSLAALYVFSGLALVFGDPITATNVGAVLFLQAWLLLILCVVYRLTQRPLLAVLGYSIAGASGLSAAFVVEFRSNLLGMACAVGALLEATAILQGSLTRRRGAVLVLWMLLAALSHRSAGPVVLCALCISAIVSHRASLALAARGWWVELTCAGVIVAGGVHRLWSALQPSLGLLVGEGPSAAAAMGSQVFGREAGSLAVWGVLASAALAVPTTARRAGATGKAETVMLATVLVAGAVVSLNPWALRAAGGSGPAERLGMWSITFLAILVPLTVNQSGWGSSRAGRVVLGLMCAATLATVHAPRHPVGLDPHFIDRQRALLAATGRVSHHLVGHVVADHGAEFLITYTTRLPASSRRELVSGLSLVTWLLDAREWKGTASREYPRPIDGWWIVNERVLIHWLQAAPKAEVQALAAQNRHLARWLALAGGSRRARAGVRVWKAVAQEAGGVAVLEPPSLGGKTAAGGPGGRPPSRATPGAATSPGSRPRPASTAPPARWSRPASRNRARG